MSRPFQGISQEMASELEKHNWPGNIRELENIIERAVIVHTGKGRLTLKRPLQIPFIPGNSHNTAEEPLPPVKALGEFKIQLLKTERDYICYILKRTNSRIWGKAGAAEILRKSLPPSKPGCRLGKD